MIVEKQVPAGEIWTLSTRTLPNTDWAQSVTENGFASFCVKGSRIFAGADGHNNFGIWYSDDDGETWNATSAAPCGYGALCIKGNRIIAGAGGHPFHYNSGICYSDDNGVTWTWSDSFSDKFGDNFVCIGAFCILGNRIIACSSSDTDGRGLSIIIYSDDAGETWTDVDLSIVYLSNVSFTSMCVFNNKVFAMTTNGTLIDSIDGATWSYTYPNNNRVINPFASWSYICATDNYLYCAYVTVKDSPEDPYPNALIFRIDTDNDNELYDLNQTSIAGGWRCLYRIGGKLIAVSQDWTTVCCFNEVDNSFTRLDSISTISAICMYNNRLIAGAKCQNVVGIYYSDPGTLLEYTSNPITKKELQALIDECKAYVQAKKQS